MNKKIIRSLLIAITGVLALGLRADPEPMFYVGETAYDSWTNAYSNANVGDTITVGANAVIDQVADGHVGVINKSVKIDLNGNDLSYAEGWLTGCTVEIVDTGMPSVTGRFEMASGRMNMSGGTLDLSALVGSQVKGNFQMSSTSLLKFPSDMELDECTSRIVIDSFDTVGGKGARIVVKGVTYVYDGTGWGVAFKITSIAVFDEVVEFGVMVPADGEVTILGSEFVNGTYNALTTTKIGDGVYQVPESTCRFFKAAMEM